MRAIAVILHVRRQILDNYVRTMRRHIAVHLVIGLGTLALVLAGGMLFFDLIFRFLREQELFGPLLMNRLMSMVLMAFFSMLIFSNLIVTLSTNYVSRETQFFMTLPLSMSEIFWAKLVETTVYSSWAFALISLPVFVSYGNALDAGLLYYPALAALLLPFIIIPAAIGAMITMVISACFPARRARTLALVLGGLSILITVLLIRSMGGRALMLSGSDSDFTVLMSMMRFGATPWLPNTWLTNGLRAAAERDWSEYFYWFAMLASTALMMGQLCAWLAPRLYYRGWALSRDSASLGRVGRRGSFFDLLDVFWRPLPPAARALTGKDVRVFWRDPAQWSQLLILFGLLFIYIANIQSAADLHRNSEALNSYWRARLSFFNMGAACFILSILTTRFVYPMLSLEGREFWIVGLAPMKRATLVWQKYALSWMAAAGFTEAVVLFSCYALKVDTVMVVVSAITILVLSFGLTSLAIGLGATSPNFREDNPARIANGLAGTLNVVLSLLYVGATLALMATIYLSFHARMRFNVSPWSFQLVLCAVALVGVNALAIVAPMAVGLRRWERMEF